MVGHTHDGQMSGFCAPVAAEAFRRLSAARTEPEPAGNRTPIPEIPAVDNTYLIADTPQVNVVNNIDDSVTEVNIRGPWNNELRSIARIYGPA